MPLCLGCSSSWLLVRLAWLEVWTVVICVCDSSSKSGRQYCVPDVLDLTALTLDRGTLPPVRLLLLLLLLSPPELGSRNQRKRGRSVTRLPAAIPRLASTLDQIEMLEVASIERDVSNRSIVWMVVVNRKPETHIGSLYPCNHEGRVYG